MNHEELLDRLPAVVWRGDPASGRFTYVSAGATALLGHPAELWLQHGFWPAHLHPDDASWVVAARAEQLASGSSHSCEYRMIAADGRVVWVRDAAAIERSDGRATRIHGVMVEVADRRAASDPSKRLLEELFRRAPVGLAAVDRELRYVCINDRLASFNGHTVAATVGHTLDEVIPNVADHVGAFVREVFAKGEPIESELVSGETAAEPGRRRHWVCDYIPLRLGGSVVAVATAVVEITERREAEDALRESEARYRYLYLRTPAIMHSIDGEGRIVDVSDAWLERLGYERAEVVGHRSVEFLTPESRDYAANEVLPEFFRTGVVTDIPYQFVRKDGVILDFRLSAVAERDSEGRFERSLAVSVDVTERNRAEAALRRSEAQLRQSQKMEAIGRLAGGVAHDFNNLLVVILGNAELLLLGRDDPLVREPAEQIVSAAERAAALTRQILTFSRQQIVQAQVLDLNELIRETQDLLRRLLREDIEVVIALHPALGRARIDPSQATQVLMNLAVNASDAMPDGGRLTIETANANVESAGACESPDYVMLSVTDTGVGMDAEAQARVFEPFFTTNELGRGTGLGLAIVYGIVRQAGGTITIDSAPGQGSSFRVYLPCVQGSA
jgi:two-component system, cell cycle sensor histidine kinase and response regulator CckA